MPSKSGDPVILDPRDAMHVGLSCEVLLCLGQQMPSEDVSAEGRRRVQ